MRIVSYNILNGGLNRRDLILEIIRIQRADVVVLVEADDPGTVKYLAEHLHMFHVHAPSGGHHAGAILSRWPITRSTNHALLGQGHWMNAFVEAQTVDSSTGVVWNIAALHFAAHASEAREQVREAQLASLFDRISHLRDRPHILAGDFNSNAPSQEFVLNKCTPRTRQEWMENGEVIPRRVVQRLLDEGYIDTHRHAEPDLAEHTGTYTTEFPGQRIDYIFTRGIDPSCIQSAWIEQTPAAREASDHFLIGAEIQ